MVDYNRSESVFAHESECSSLSAVVASHSPCGWRHAPISSLRGCLSPMGQQQQPHYLDEVISLPAAEGIAQEVAKQVQEELQDNIGDKNINDIDFKLMLVIMVDASDDKNTWTHRYWPFPKRY